MAFKLQISFNYIVEKNVLIHISFASTVEETQMFY